MKGVRSVNLRTRLVALVFAVSIVPLAFIHLTIGQFRIMQVNGKVTPIMLADSIQKTIAVESVMFMVISVLIALLVLHHLRKTRCGNHPHHEPCKKRGPQCKGIRLHHG